MIIARPGVDTEHCEWCHRCIERMDHHCPWSSKCIAKGNLYYFYLFVSLTFMLTTYCIGSSLFLGFTAATTAEADPVNH